jgi:putative membrane protein
MANEPSILAILIFVVEFFIPAILKFFRYYNYRIVRDGDTVVISSGLFATRQDTFELSKVNFVKIREPLVCRFLGRAILEAEVVGTADGEGMPLLCPLKDKGIAVALFESLLPEFQCDAELKSQSKVSLYAITLWMSVTLLAAAGFFYLVMFEVPGEYAMFVNGLFVLVAALTLGWGYLAYKIRRFSMTDTIALMVTGAFDRLSNYVLIDKVQFADVRTSPVMRRTGTARCAVSMLSTLGQTTIVTGVFDVNDLEALPTLVLDRIKDGRYDFRRYQ